VSTSNQRTLRILGLGTYYGKKADEPAPDADQLRRLAWHVKAKWKLGPVRVTYQGMPQTLLWNQHQACEFVAEFWANVWEALCDYFEVPNNGDVDLVPVPSSEVTKDNFRTARWGADKIAAAMQRRKLGTVKHCVVNRTSTQPSHESVERQTAKEIFDNYEVIARPQRHVLYIDDIFTQGRHLAALDSVLQRPAIAGMLVIGFTDYEHRATCLDLRGKTLQYTDMNSSIAVSDDD
jgi:hypothetical protein